MDEKFDAHDGVKDLMTGSKIAALVETPAIRAVVLLDAEIDFKDLRIDVYRPSSSGSKDLSHSVRVTHIPSGVAVAHHGETSQTRNRARAIHLLRLRLYESNYLQQRSIGIHEPVPIEAGQQFSVRSL
jgi:protein subunit release factor A